MDAIRMLARVQLRRSLTTMVLLGVLAGVTAGIVMGSVQLARRTSTAHARLERAAGVPDAVLLQLGGADATKAVTHLPQVASTLDMATGIAQIGRDQRFLAVVGPRGDSPPGLFSPMIVAGRAPDPRAADEVVLSENIAEPNGIKVGKVLDLSFLTTEEVGQFDTGFGRPDGPRLRMRVVGIARTAMDQGNNVFEAYATRAFARTIGPSAYSTVLVRLRHGTDALPEFRREVRAIARANGPVAGAEEFSGIEVQVPSRQRSVQAVTARVLDAGILAFAAVAGIAGLLGAGLALRRHFQVTIAPDRPAMRAIGVTRRELRVACLLAGVPFVAVGTVVSALVAVALGALDPLGNVARQEPHPGWHANLALIGVGSVIVALLLVVVVLVAGPGRVHARSGGSPRRSALAGRLGGIGATPPAVVGAQMALVPGRGRTAVPVRSALVGTTLGVFGLVAVLVFSASLSRLVDTPARWGWNADALVLDAKPHTFALLDRDPRVAAVTRYDEFDLEVQGQDVTANVFHRDRGAAPWSILDGHLPDRPGQIVLGARLAREVDRHLGDQVELRGADGGRRRFTVVGIGTGPNQNDQQFGGGALVSPGDVARVGQSQPFIGASVRLRDGVDSKAFATGLARAAEVDLPARPPDVQNLAELGSLPDLLALFLAVVGVTVLGYLLLTTTRRRRRDLDTLRAMGFVPRQVRMLVATVAVVTVGVGLIIGLPLGIAAGRLGWQLTARSVYVAQDTLVPLGSLVAFVAATLVVALLAAAWPAWRAANEPAARGLRDE